MWINGWEALDGSQHKNASSITEATKDDVYAHKERVLCLLTTNVTSSSDGIMNFITAYSGRMLSELFKTRTDPVS